MNSPRGVVFSTPGTGFLVSANSGGATPVLFGFPSEFQVFSAQKLFTATGSTVTDVNFFLPGTNTPATISAFGAVFTSVETANLTKLEFFDANNTLLYSRFVLVDGAGGLSFTGAVANAGEAIARVHITAGAATTITANGVRSGSGDLVAMDDFLFAEPVPEPASVALFVLGLLGLGAARRRMRAA